MVTVSQNDRFRAKSAYIGHQELKLAKNANLSYWLRMYQYLYCAVIFVIRAQYKQASFPGFTAYSYLNSETGTRLVWERDQRSYDLPRHSDIGSWSYSCAKADACEVGRTSTVQAPGVGTYTAIRSDWRWGGYFCRRFSYCWLHQVSREIDDKETYLLHKLTSFILSCPPPHHTHSYQ